MKSNKRGDTPLFFFRGKIPAGPQPALRTEFSFGKIAQIFRLNFVHFAQTLKNPEKFLRKCLTKPLLYGIIISELRESP